MDAFAAEELSKQIKREKEKARELRRTRWWQNRIAKTACYYCRKPLTREEVTMDHVVPLSRGGKTTKGNIVVACKPCNNNKKYLTLVEWQQYLDDACTGTPLPSVTSEASSQDA